MARLEMWLTLVGLLLLLNSKSGFCQSADNFTCPQTGGRNFYLDNYFSRSSYLTFNIFSDTSNGGFYRDNSNCKIQFVSGRTPINVFVTFKRLDLELVEDCRYDSICFVNGVKWCGTRDQEETYNTVVPANNTLTFLFKSDVSVTRSGFHVQVAIYPTTPDATASEPAVPYAPRQFSVYHQETKNQSNYVDLCNNDNSVYNAYTTSYPWGSDSSTNYPWQSGSTAGYPYDGESTTRYPWYSGSSTSYPWQSESTTRYPWYSGSSTSYPWQSESTTRYPWYSGSSTRYPWESESTTRYPWYSGSSTRYPWESESTTRYPWYSGSSTRYPWESESTTGYPWQSGSDTRYPWESESTTGYPWQSGSNTRYPWESESSSDRVNNVAEEVQELKSEIRNAQSSLSRANYLALDIERQVDQN